MTIRRRKKGLFELRYTSNGKQVSVYGKSKKECLKRYREQVKGKSTIHSKSMIFSTWFEKWVDIYKKPYIKAETLNKIIANFNNHILKYIGEMPIKRIHTDNLQFIVNNLCSLPRQQSIICQQLNACFSQAVACNVIYHNPCSALIYKKNKGNKGLALTKEQTAKLVKYLNTECDEETRKLFLIYLNTGIRRNELLSIKYSDLDYTKNELHIKGTKTKNADRVIQVSREILDLFPKQDIPFNNLTKSIIDYRFKKITTALKFDKICVHSLRHTFATRCIESGVEPIVLSSWLGHKDISMTLNRYTHISNDYKQKESEKIQPILT